MTDYELALKIATTAHKGKVDKAGVDYINHPIAVASTLSGEKEKVVALLHDVCEDSDVQIATIRDLFGDEIADAVDCMTHAKGESYEAYIRRIALNEIATNVKLADLTHNMDLTRMPEVTDKDLKRVEKYKKAYSFLDYVKQGKL